MQGLLEWMKGFDIRKHDGENVAVAVTYFKAVLKALGAHAPPDPACALLQGLSHASNKDFGKLCDSQLGILDSMMYQRQLLTDKTTPAQEVDEFGSVVVRRFTSMNQSMEWSSINHKGSVYRASLLPPDSKQALVVDKSKVKGKLPFKEWWDTETCELLAAVANTQRSITTTLMLATVPTVRPPSSQQQKPSREISQQFQPTLKPT